MAPSITVALYGFGNVNRSVLELALSRPWLEVTAVIARSPARAGHSVAALVRGAPRDLRIRIDAAAAFAETHPDVAVIATSSTLRDVLPQLRVAAEAGAAIVCTAEELAYVEPGDGPEASEVHRLARSAAVPIIAAGVNPGFVLDLWPLVASGVAWDVKAIRARRVVDVSVFGPVVRSRLGIGYKPDSFSTGVADGSIVGHVGFVQSLRLIGASLGRPIEDVRIETLPIVTDVPIALQHLHIAAGRTAGVSQRAIGFVDGAPWIEIEMTLHVAPERVGLRPVDSLAIDGRHSVSVEITPGCGAVLGTAALLVNSIPRALAAPPGLYSPGSLPPSAPWLAAAPPPGTAPTFEQSRQATRINGGDSRS